MFVPGDGRRTQTLLHLSIIIRLHFAEGRFGKYTHPHTSRGREQVLPRQTHGAGPNLSMNELFAPWDCLPVCSTMYDIDRLSSLFRRCCYLNSI
jgi:hypothetical protein